jgi:short-subunit dehydrogenase
MIMQLLVLGANSEIALHVARTFADLEKADVYLASRDMERLEKRATDLAVRYGVKAVPLYFDALDYDSHADFYARLDPKPDVVVAAFGVFGNQKKARTDMGLARKIIDTNFTALASILSVVAEDFERRGHGSIIGVSSVAGERGRQSNYYYGAAKAGATIFLAGLRNRLHRRGVQVLTVLPGFVRTPMTEGLDLPERLIADPARVAADIHRAWKKGKNILYTPWFWQVIMFLIRITPEAIFKRLQM